MGITISSVYGVGFIVLRANSLQAVNGTTAFNTYRLNLTPDDPPSIPFDVKRDEALIVAVGAEWKLVNDRFQDLAGALNDVPVVRTYRGQNFLNIYNIYNIKAGLYHIVPRGPSELRAALQREAAALVGQSTTPLISQLIGALISQLGNFATRSLLSLLGIAGS